MKPGLILLNHLAHGYLLHEFLSSYFNKRDDMYGGNLDGRFRIIKNILDESYKQRPNLKGKIGFRISANDYVKKGLTMNVSKKIVNLLDKFKPLYCCNCRLV